VAKQVDLASKTVSKQPEQGSPHKSKHNSYYLDDEKDEFLHEIHCLTPEENLKVIIARLTRMNLIGMSLRVSWASRTSARKAPHVHHKNKSTACKT
jgi:hypothetical protein